MVGFSFAMAGFYLAEVTRRGIREIGGWFFICNGWFLPGRGDRKESQGRWWLVFHLKLLDFTWQR